MKLVAFIIASVAMALVFATVMLLIRISWGMEPQFYSFVLGSIMGALLVTVAPDWR